MRRLAFHRPTGLVPHFPPPEFRPRILQSCIFSRPARPSVSSSLTALSQMHHLTCGISSRFHPVNLIWISVHSPPGSPHPAHTPHHSHHISSSTTPSVFHSRLKTRLFHKSFPPRQGHSDCFHGSWTCTELNGHWRLFVLVSCFSYFFWLRVLD